MRHAVLGLLARRPAHGYELKVAYDRLFGRIWPQVNVGQVYTTLQRLERDGLVEGNAVEQAHKPDKRVYALTPSGREELRRWLSEPVAEPRLKDEFFLKLVMARLADLDATTEPMLLIERQRRGYLEALRDLNELVSRLDASGDEIGSLIAEGAILHLKADLEWLELLQLRIG
jgi:DNA-binding PadR family transcriptional regulator